MDYGKNLINVLPLGKIPEIVIRALSVNISANLRLPSRILSPKKQPEYAFDKKRLQYDAGLILTSLETLPVHSAQKIIAVCDIDLFIPVLTHVYGEARQGGRCALVSLFRLNNHPSQSKVSAQTMERSLKVAFHEIGHLFNLFHCDDEYCLMHFSFDFDQLDKKSLSFCRYCLKSFNNATA